MDGSNLLEHRLGRLTAAVVLVLLTATLQAAAPRPVRELAADDQRPQIATLLTARREAVKTIEAARAAAEQDLLIALAQQPHNNPRIASLLAEIAAFDDEIEQAGSTMRARIEQLLRSAGTRTIEP